MTLDEFAVVVLIAALLPMAIKGMRFKPMTVDESGFPISITVVTDKGLEKVYHC